MNTRLLKKRHILILLLFINIFNINNAISATSPIFISDQEKITLTPYINWYYDASSKATIDDISSQPTLFVNKLNNTGLPRKKGAYWLQLKLKPSKEAISKNWLIELTYTQLDYVDFYVVKHASPTRHYLDGDLRVKANNDITQQYPLPTFPLLINSEDIIEIFIRVKSSTSISIPLTLWQRDYFSVDRQITTLFNGVIYGVLIGLMLYNLCLYPAVRDSAYLWFSGFLSAFLFFQISIAGLTQFYLFPNWPEAVDRSASLGLWLSMACGIRFTQYIALSQKYSPRLNRILNAMAYFSLGMFALVLLVGPGPVFFLLPASGVIVALLIPLPLIFAWQKKYPPARFSLFAFIPIMPGVSLIVARSYGLIDASFWTESLLSIGIAISALLLSFALADRISFLRNEKLQVQSALIKTINAAEKTKRGFSIQLINAQDQERKRIAEDLHDSVGQNISFLASTINRLAKSYGDDNLKLAKQVTQDTVNEIRMLSHQLHPHILDQLGLASAIESISDRINQQFKIRCEVEMTNKLDGLTTEMELQIYRIIQESTNNIIKHSHATHAIISLNQKNDYIYISIIDNGVGLQEYNANNPRQNPLNSSTNPSGLGMKSMEHRAEIMDGTFTLSKNHPNGLIITIVLPIPNRQG